MARLLLILLPALLLAVVTAQMAPAQELRVAGSTAVNLREGPGTQYRVIGQIDAATTDLFQLSRDGDWIWTSKNGYVNARLVERRDPVRPRPAPMVRVLSPDTLVEGNLAAVSPSGKQAFYTGRDGAFITDATTGRVLSRVTALDSKLLNIEAFLSNLANDQTMKRFQFLTDTILVASASVEISYAQRSERQVLIDLESDSIIYDGATLVYPIVYWPQDGGYSDLVVNYGGGLMTMDPATLEAKNFFTFGEVFADLDYRAREFWPRFAGMSVENVPLFLVHVRGKDGRRGVLRVDAEGQSQGRMIWLNDDEYLMEAMNDNYHFVTVAMDSDFSPAYNLGDTLFQSPIGEVSTREQAPFTVRLRDQTGAVRKTWPASERILEVSTDRARAHVYLTRPLAPSATPTMARDQTTRFSVATMTETPPRDFILSDEKAGVASLQRVGLRVPSPTAPAAAEPRITNLNEPARIRPDGLIQVYGSLVRVDDRVIYDPGMVLDLTRVVAQPLPLDTDPTSSWIGSYFDDATRFFEPISSFDRKDGNTGPLGERLIARKRDLTLGVLSADGGEFVPLQGLRVPRDSDETIRVLGEFREDPIYSGYDEATDRSAYVIEAKGMAFSADGQRVYAQRYGLCADADCTSRKPVTYETDWEKWDAALWREFVVFDAATGRELVAHRLPSGKDCKFYDERIRVARDDDSVYLRGCATGPLMRLDVATGQMTKVFEGRANDLVQRADDRNGLFSDFLFTPDGRYIVVQGTKGPTASVHNRKTGELLADFHLFPGKAWVLLTPDGFYSAGGNGAANIEITQGTRRFSFERFQSALNRPDLVFETLRGDPEGIVARARAQISLAQVLQSGQAPLVTVSARQDRNRADVTATVQDAGGGIGAVEWRVNGVVRHRVRAGATQTVSLDLAEGRNIIEIVAFNAGDLIETRSDPIELTVSSEDSAPPRLFVVAAGVNDYDQDILDLNYAVSDAQNVVAAFEAAGAGLYDEITTIILSDRDVTRDNLARVFADLSRAVRPNDVFVFFLAGHGKTLDGRYFFIPPDFAGQTLGALRDQGIGQSLFAEWFAAVPAQKSLLLFDTCDSGSLVETEVGRELGNQLANQLLGNAVGRAILSASSSQGVALEGYEGSGLFTHVLIDALKTADRDANGLIDVLELANEVAEHLPSLALSAFGEDQQSAFRPPVQMFQVVRQVSLE